MTHTSRVAEKRPYRAPGLREIRLSIEKNIMELSNVPDIEEDPDNPGFEDY